jgi:uncharacterized protein (DUF2126 family)
MQSANAASSGEAPSPERGSSARGIVRSTLCVEPRGGVLYVFMSPLDTVESYLELVAAVERTAARLSMRVMLEGYPPPSDPRLSHFLITPDPGVIEVNIHPSGSWGGLVSRPRRLRGAGGRPVERDLQLDGRHTGGRWQSLRARRCHTGRQPFLRRPDCCEAWSAIGTTTRLSPTCSRACSSTHSRRAAHRRGFHDSVYEIELAFSRFPAAGAPVRRGSWTGRSGICCDVTGNASGQFTIDKLYSPDTASGRRGLVEMRAFEMPPMRE